MSDKIVSKAQPVTPAEEYLRKLCEKAFLSLWSYPAPYRDEGRRDGKGHGREICDLLVVFGNHVIVISDKHCDFKYTRGTGVAWASWFKKSIWESAGQACGAANWLRANPERVFLDRECTKPLPLTIPADARIHLVVVAHGISHIIRTALGDSGTFMVDSSVKGLAQHGSPFTVGDLDPTKPFVHILDDEALLAVLLHRDTVPDFIAYLDKREQLLRGPRAIMSTGEEELLAVYLTKMNAQDEHDFAFPLPDGKSADGIFLDRGHWDRFQASPERRRQIVEDKDSYIWDRLIEHFSGHALGGTLAVGELGQSEFMLRWMAGEPRLMRRMLGKSLRVTLEKTLTGDRFIRVLPSLTQGRPWYVFVLYARPAEASYDEYRKARAMLLEYCCRIVRLENETALDIVGIAMEPQKPNSGGSEDLCYFDGRVWNDELAADTKQFQEETGILRHTTPYRQHVKEFPDGPPESPAAS